MAILMRYEKKNQRHRKLLKWRKWTTERRQQSQVTGNDKWQNI